LIELKGKLGSLFPKKFPRSSKPEIITCTNVTRKKREENDDSQQDQGQYREYAEIIGQKYSMYRSLYTENL